MIINSQRNSNTSVQASSFNGGNLAQSFNLQGIRVIKGYTYLIPPEYGYSTFSDNSLFFNTYDNSPIFLSCGDVILSAIIENDGTNITSTNNSANIRIYFAGTPIFNSEKNTWEPGQIDWYSFSSNTITIQDLNIGYNIPMNAFDSIYGKFNGRFTEWPICYNTPLYYNNWINCVVNMNGDTITSPNPIVKLTLLILNSFNA